MKKVVLSVAIMSFALLANAQVLKKDLLKDYKPGDQLEKAVYGDKKAPCLLTDFLLLPAD